MVQYADKLTRMNKVLQLNKYLLQNLACTAGSRLSYSYLYSSKNIWCILMHALKSPSIEILIYQQLAFNITILCTITDKCRTKCVFNAAHPLFCTDTVRVSGPKAAAISLERRVERVQPAELDPRRFRHIITIYSVFLQNPLIAVGRDSCLDWTRLWEDDWGRVWSWVPRAHVTIGFIIVDAGNRNELSGTGSRCCTFADADVVAREQTLAVGVGGVPSIEVVK